MRVFRKTRLRNGCSRRGPLITGKSPELVFVGFLGLIRAMMRMNAAAARTLLNYKLPITNYRFPALLLNQRALDTIASTLMIASELKHTMHQTPSTRASM